MTHLHFVIAAYAALAIGLGGLLIWLLADMRRQQKALRELERIAAKQPSGNGRHSPDERS